jgi:hypothetical protein
MRIALAIVRIKQMIARRIGIRDEVIKGASPKIVKKSLAETNQRNLQTLWRLSSNRGFRMVLYGII